ncbi:Spy/CpxP family protein refolding chaperone [Azohydromonas sediminis]|uniref:Spy/CpxP family protein refolding chaperone n=1 Tax=Azohydromonas sediminis TaxID=2259674 RepID=UPI000E647AFB|nr:Spy/CpxP family protein refolding chaperone [Azohydromonas sediminis]
MTPIPRISSFDRATVSRRTRWALAAVPLVAALLAAAVLPAQAHGGMGPHGRHDSAAIGAGPMGLPLAGRGLERMLDRVDASAEQRAQIRAIVDAARKDLEPLREQQRALREQALALFAQPNVDANAIEAQRQQMLRQHDEVTRRTTQAMIDVARVLTPQQRATLAEHARQRREMMQRHWQERQRLDAPRGS